MGLEKAATRGELLFSRSDITLQPGKSPPGDPEAFADVIGGIVNEFERQVDRAHTAVHRSDQRLLPGGGAPAEDGGAGSEPGAEGSDWRDCELGVDGTEQRGRVLEFPTQPAAGRGAPEGISRRLVLLELREHQADLQAFQGAYSCIHKRVQEVKDESQLMKLVNWSGTSAVMGSLELSIHAIEHVVEELQQLLQRLDMGEIHNTDED